MGFLFVKLCVTHTSDTSYTYQLSLPPYRSGEVETGVSMLRPGWLKQTLTVRLRINFHSSKDLRSTAELTH